MQRHRFDKKLHGSVDLDLCFACHGIWFDEWESLQLAPGGVVELFKLINKHRDAPRLPLADPLRCPHCAEDLLHALDRAKSGSFNYHRCLQQHGRFTTFAQFMIEKGFVRQLSGAEIERLKAKVDVVRCSSCGAPVDIKREHACSHCRSPLAILDPDAVDQALASYHQAEVRRTALSPDALADSIIMFERDKNRRQREARSNPLERDLSDLVIGGLVVVLSLLFR